MHSHIALNDQLLARDTARLGAVSDAMLYGRGVFTTLSIHNSMPLSWEAHWTRLADHATRINISILKLDEAIARAQLIKLIERNDMVQGRARITLLARGISGAWGVENGQDDNDTAEHDDRPLNVANIANVASDAPQTPRDTDLLIATGEPRAISPEGFALTVSPYRINTHSPLVNLKTINYLDPLLAWEEARRRGFDDAVRLNESGEVVSAALANIFWTQDGTLHTPALHCGALAGTTRALALALAAALAIPTIEGAYQIHDLADADEIFLTSAALGITPCHAFDFRRYTSHAGSLTLRLREALRQHTLS